MKSNICFFTIVGLYSSFVLPLVYAVLGSSRDLAVGPVSIASRVLGSMLRQEVSPTGDPVLFLQVAFTSTSFAGLFQASLGILRLGFIIDFLSKAILIGFMAGAAIIVSLQQLKSLLGITHFTTGMGLIPVMTSVFHNTNEVLSLFTHLHCILCEGGSFNFNLRWSQTGEGTSILICNLECD